MKATEMTATRTGRLTRIAAAFVGLLAAALLLAGMQAKSADAAFVANPGTFTVQFTNGGGDGIRFSNGSINEGRWPFSAFSNPSPPSFPITVNADGTFTASTGSLSFQSKDIHNDCLTGAWLCIGAPKGVKSKPEVGGTWNGTIDPATGVITMNMPMRLKNNSRSGTDIPDCYVGGADTGPIGIHPATNKASGVAYNFVAGTARLADAGWTTPMPGGLNGGGGSGNCDRTANWKTPMNLPSSDTWFRAYVTIKDGSGEGVRPFPKPTFTVSPNPVGEGDTVTLDASASLMSGFLDACPDPDTDTGCGYEWDFNNDGTVDKRTNTPTVTTSYATAGGYTAKLTINSNVGTVESTTRAVTVQIHPAAQIDAHPPAVTKETVNEFEFSIPVNPDSATTQCSVDGGAWSACASGDDFTFSQADDTTGSHNFRVRGITPGGVVGPPAQYTFTIDRVKPRVTVDTHPVNPTNVTSASFTFTADKPNTDLECQLDGGAWVPCGTGSTGSRSYSGLAETSPNPIEAPNPHQFRVRATDQYGNVGGDGNPGGGAYDWDIDLTAPGQTWTTTPANPSNDLDPSFVWANSESIQLAQCRLAINGTQGPWANCGSLTTKAFSSMADADYAFAIRTLDIAGNWSAVKTYSWKLETATPPISIVGKPAAKSNRTSAQFLFDTEPGATTRCQLDAQPVQDPCPSGVKYSYLAAGTHIFSVTATDPALNETTETYSWDIKTAKPAVQIVAASVPAASSTSADASFELTTVNGDAECRLDGAAWMACDSNATQDYTGLADGHHTFEVRAIDEYTNVSAVDGYSWLVVANAPVVNLGAKPAAKTNSSTGSFTFAVDTADGNTTTSCTLDGVTTFACGSPAVVTQLADGPHTFEVTATDTAGQTNTASHTWTVKAKIPGLGFDQTPAAIANTTSATFEFSSDEDPDVTYECRTDSGPYAACSSPANLTGLSQGNHSFTVRATDDVDNRATEAYIWNVDSIAPSVSFDQAPSGSSTKVAQLIKFHASESGVSYSCKLDDAAWAACGSPALVKHLSLGAHTFKVKATDAAGNTGAEAVATWSVTAPEAPTGLRAEPRRAGGAAAARGKTRAKAKTRARAKAKAKAKAKKKRPRAKARRGRR